jgi:hypothetical protein
VPTRSRDEGEEVSRDLKDLDRARIFLCGLVDEGDDLQTALGRRIRHYGVKEYSSLVKIEAPAVQRAIDPRHNPTKQTLEKLLAPFKLSLGVKPVDAA